MYCCIQKSVFILVAIIDIIFWFSLFAIMAYQFLMGYLMLKFDLFVNVWLQS